MRSNYMSQIQSDNVDMLRAFWKAINSGPDSASIMSIKMGISGNKISVSILRSLVGGGTGVEITTYALDPEKAPKV